MQPKFFPLSLFAAIVSYAGGTRRETGYIDFLVKNTFALSL
jgi:hypothetical protein